MTISIIQIILIIFILFAISRVILRFKEKRIGWRVFLFWSTIWVLGIIVISLPSTAEYIAQLLGIGRAVDLILYVSVALLFYLIFRIYVKINQIDEAITKVVRDIAIEKTKHKHEPKSTKEN